MLPGIRVVELGTTITAPLTAVLLADLGADVIKVERPEGDPFRTFRGTGSPYFQAYNRGKRSVVLDLTLPEKQRTLQTLLRNSDVFIDNVRPDVLPRIGLDPAALQAASPQLIHCSITGFGASGPYRSRPAFDAVAQAFSGMSSLSIDPSTPELTGPTISDNVTGMYACIAILGALARRTATGKGGRLEVNMLEATMAFIGDHFAAALQVELIPGRFSRVAGSQSYAFTCADGRLIAIHLSSIDKFWSGLLGAVAAPELAADVRFSTRAGRVDHYIELRGALAARFAGKDRATWIERLTAADVPFAPVHDLTEAVADPQVLALGTVDRDHRGIASPILLDGERPTALRPAPQLGEHTAAVCNAAAS